MKIISIINQKGGVGKTLSTLNLAAAIADTEKNKKIAIVDLDPQASLTISLGFEPEDFPVNISDVLDQKQPINKIIFQSGLLDNLFIIPSHGSLSATEVKMATMKDSYLYLRDVLGDIEDKFDYILIDCPPQLSLLTMSAITASNYYIVPCTAEYLPYRGLKQITSTVLDMQQLINTKIECLGVIVTMYNNRINAEKEVYAALEKDYSILGVTKRTTKANMGIYEGKPVVMAAPKEPIAKEYMRIATDILKKIR